MEDYCSVRRFVRSFCLVGKVALFRGSHSSHSHLARSISCSVFFLLLSVDLLHHQPVPTLFKLLLPSLPSPVPPSPFSIAFFSFYCFFVHLHLPVIFLSRSVFASLSLPFCICCSPPRFLVLYLTASRLSVVLRSASLCVLASYRPGLVLLLVAL